MSDAAETPTGQHVPASPTPGGGGGAGGPAAVVQDRPEVAVGAAFAGGFVVAMILKRLASRD